MKPETLIDVLDAAHLTHLVESPFKQRGGIMLIAPPGQMKTSMMYYSLQGYNDALVMSDVNITTLMNMRTDIISGKFTTLAFPALEKLYARHSSTASNIEATLMALAEEGFTRASFEDQRAPMRPARALILGATFPSCIDKKYSEWIKSGFSRRFIWVNYSIENPKEILQAIHRWQPIKFGKFSRIAIIGDSIPYNLTEMESSVVMDVMKHQNEATPIVLMKKIFCVLKYKYDDDTKKVRNIMEEFGESLTKDGTYMQLPKYVKRVEEPIAEIPDATIRNTETYNSEEPYEL